MKTAVQTYTWREFLNTIAAMPVEELTEDVLCDMVQRLTIDSGLLAPYIQFSETGYARNVLFRDEKFEAICLCWEPGQGTAIHNHGRSYGVAYVYEGALAISNYVRVDDRTQEGHAKLHAVNEMYVPAGGLSLDRVGGIHALSNPPNSGRRTVSLHFYAGPLDVMEIFEPQFDRVTLKPMQAEPMAYIEPEAHIMAAMI